MDKFNSYEKRLIVDSERRKDMFLKSGDVLKSAFLGKPVRVVDVYGVKALGYNYRMDKFYKKYKKNEFGFEIGSISVVLANILSTKTRTVTLSNDTLAKNLRHHPELTESEYVMLDDIVGKSHFVAKDGNKTVAIVLDKDSKRLYHYALKSTSSGKGLFLTSFRRTRIKQVNRLREKNKQGKVKVIKDNLP